nr:Putative uncharacterized protein [Moritella viscosa]
MTPNTIKAMAMQMYKIVICKLYTVLLIPVTPSVIFMFDC